MTKIVIAYRNDGIDVADGPPAAYQITFTRPDGTAANQNEADAILNVLGTVRANRKNLKLATSSTGEQHEAFMLGAGPDETYTVSLQRDDGKSFAKHEATMALVSLALERHRESLDPR